MDLTLFFSALLLGVAGAPHCAAMCGPASAAALRGCGAAMPRRTTLGFHAARVASYAAAGALAAAGVGLLEYWGQWSALLRPFWTLLHCAALALGLWLVITARQPGWMERRGNARPAPATSSSAWQPVRGPLAAGAAGALWVAWPCGLLQSALVVAALANTAWGGAAAMAGFALTSAAGLGLAPWLLQRLGGGRGAARRASRWVTRAAGAALALASAWALGHDLWVRVLDYCFA